MWQLADRIDSVLNESETNDEWPGCCIASAQVDTGDAWDYRSVDKECMLHVAAAKKATRGAKYASLAMDKADIRSLGVQNGACVLPNNVGFALIPQVDAFAYRGPFTG